MRSSGDKNVEYYNIYSGTEPEPTTVLDSSQVTMKILTGLENMTRHFFRVTAVYSDGRESDYSTEVNALVKNLQPGENMVLNGDFSSDLAQWWYGGWEVDATLQVTQDGECKIEIVNGGDQMDQLYMVQDGMPLVRGKDYRFEFDAYAAENRTIVPQIIGVQGSLVNYSRTGTTALRRAKEHFSFDFNMRSSSDANALLVFFVGGSNADVYVDNVSIYEVVQDDVSSGSSDNRVPGIYELLPAYPNPFNQNTTITYALPEKSHVKLTIYNLLGERVQEPLDKQQNAGLYNIRIDGSNLSTGVYFYEIVANSSSSDRMFRSMEKMMMVR